MIVNKSNYKKELNLIQDACCKFNGRFKESDIAYEIARYESDSGSIIFYQYKTSAGNHNIRSKISNMVKPEIADVILWLQEKSGNNVLFDVKNIGSGWTDKQKRSELINRSQK